MESGVDQIVIAMNSFEPEKAVLKSEN